MTCRSSSREPSRLTIEWSSEITILTWVPPSDGLPSRGSPEVSVNSFSLPGPRRVPSPYARHAIRAASSGWPGQPAAAQHVGVGVGHGLPCLRAGVEHDAVSAVADSLVHRDLMGLNCHFSQQPVARRGERGEVRIVLFRYHKHMRRSLRAYVAESNCSWRLEYARCRDIARHDPAEYALWHEAILACWSLGTNHDIYS